MSETNITTQNNNKKHISFEEFFPRGWRDYFRKEEVLLKIIQAAGLAQTHDFVKVNTTYLVDENRIALIVLLKKKGTEILDKLIIDAISGHPQFEQIMDVLYVVGADAGYHIILYDNNTQHHSHHPIIGYILTSLLEEMLGCTFLTVMGIDLEIGDENVINFQCVDGQAIIKDKDEKLPERDYLEKLEFWNFYFLPARFQDDETDYSSWHGEQHEEAGDWTRSFACWDESGMIINYSIDKEILRPLLTKNNLKEIKTIFEGCTVQREIQESRTMTVPLCHVLDNWPDDEIHRLMSEGMTICRPIPFRNFIYSLPEDRESLAEQFKYYGVIISYFEELALGSV